MAVGASGARIGWLALRSPLATAGLGLVLGIPASLALGKLVRRGLYGVEAADPATIAVAVAAMLVAAAIAGCIPARRAARVDPMVALRYD